MQLHFKVHGAGHPLLILHGLFGTSDNWQTLGKKLAKDYMVYLIDLRNHGRSFHHDDISYRDMAEDVHRLMNDEWLHEAYVIGHSMGGKTAMQLALNYPDQVQKLVVVDIAPKAYVGGHQEIINALLGVDLGIHTQRTSIAEQLGQTISDPGVVQFLMKNLARQKETGGFRWKMNLKALSTHYPKILELIQGEDAFDNPSLFVRGGNSNYVLDSDLGDIQQLFPEAVLETVPNAGHWVHAEQPDQLLQVLKGFLD